tara:strand:- start:1032 stop:1361 length:330 start_codon:yes stop_codon:yes gene_type:complete
MQINKNRSKTMINTIKTFLKRKYIQIWHHAILDDNYGYAEHNIHGTCKCWGGDFECGMPSSVRQECQRNLRDYRVIEALYNQDELKDFNDFVDVQADKRFEEHLRSLNS